MSNNDPPPHSKASYNVLDKLSHRISAIKGDITEAVKERSRSYSSDRYNSMSLTNSLASVNSVKLSLKDDTQSIMIQTVKSFKTSGKY